MGGGTGGLDGGDLLGRESNASSIEQRAASARALEKAYLGPEGRSDDVGVLHPDRLRRVIRRCAALPLNFTYALLVAARVGDARERTLPEWVAPEASHYALMFAQYLLAWKNGISSSTHTHRLHSSIFSPPPISRRQCLTAYVNHVYTAQ